MTQTSLTPPATITCDRGQADLVLACALNIARRIVECGGEVRRAEETVEFICHAYGIEEMEVFAILSEIQATIRTPDGRYITQIVRIHNWQNNLRQLDAYNTLSRRICTEKPDPALLEGLYRDAEKDDKPRRLLTMLCYYGGAAAFCIFFGGSLFDAFAAGLVGLVLFVLDTLKPRWMNSVAHGVIASAAAGIITLLLTQFHIGDNVGHIMMGTVMLLTPGLALGNAIRDLLCGDLIAGALRLMQVFLAAVAIAAGLVVTVWLGGVLF
ncbi:MAG: threonine/serine exporter family protein [Eubacteriales bacterium]